MTPEERSILTAELDRLQNQRLQDLATNQPGANLYIETYNKFRHAEIAFPGMDFEEFMAVSIGRARSRGRPRADSSKRAETPIFEAARDFDDIRHSIPNIAREDVLEFCAQLHNVDTNALNEIVRRSGSRRHDRLARRR